MSHRSIYLAMFRTSRNMRAHFAVFIPNADFDRSSLSEDYASVPSKGTSIHVTGSPIHGYVLEIKRNYDCSTSEDPLTKLVSLGAVDETYLYDPTSDHFIREPITRSTLENYASSVSPPPGNQDVRVPIDGVATRRCQEWTMEFLNLLVTEGVLHSAALTAAQEQRDPPTHGIFGYKNRE